MAADHAPHGFCTTRGRQTEHKVRLTDLKPSLTPSIYRLPKALTSADAEADSRAALREKWRINFALPRQVHTSGE
jgi:hypothetical protein